ncbi:MAG: twin-arginine translocase TatA/TatE family subunit [Streptosporangiaceae bacterium]
MFDPSAPHIIILLIVVLLLFGSRRLPGAARSLGQSMHIFKKSVSGLDTDDDENGTAANPKALQTGAAPVLPPPAVDTHQQLQDLQRQVEELQRQSAVGGARSEDQTAQPR